MSETNYKFFIQFNFYAAFYTLYTLIVMAYFVAEANSRVSISPHRGPTIFLTCIAVRRHSQRTLGRRTRSGRTIHALQRRHVRHLSPNGSNQRDHNRQHRPRKPDHVPRRPHRRTPTARLITSTARTPGRLARRLRAQERGVKVEHRQGPPRRPRPPLSPPQKHTHTAPLAGHHHLPALHQTHRDWAQQPAPTSANPNVRDPVHAAGHEPVQSAQRARKPAHRDGS